MHIALGMRVLVARGRRVSLLLVRERSRRLLVHLGSKGRPSGPGTDHSCQSSWAYGVLPLPATWAYEEGLPLETRISGFRDSAVPVNCGTGADTVYSSTPWYGAEEPVSVLGSCTGTSHYTSRPERPDYGRGRGRGPQVRTSGVQGFVYAITPPVESADQPIIQGTFFYLAYGQEYYLILVHRIHLSLHRL